MDNNKKYLLLLPCSKTKKPLLEAPAIEVYDGPFYRVIKKNRPKNLDIEILSAKYGLINSKDIISYYDQIMTIERAEELSSSIKIKLEKILTENYAEVFINLGKTYILALEKSKDMLDEYDIRWGHGQIGERLHQLKNWVNVVNVIKKENKAIL